MKSLILLSVFPLHTQHNKRISQFKKITVFFFLILFGLATQSRANAVVWTAGEIINALEQAKANGQPFDRLLAQKVEEEMTKAGLFIIDDSLTYQTSIPAVRTNLGVALDDAEAEPWLRVILDGYGMAHQLGECTLPIPEGSLNNVRSSITDVEAKFSNTGTYIDFKTNPNQVILTLGISAEVNAHTNLGMEWCGVVAWPYDCSLYVKNPACPPPVCVPSICGRWPFKYPCCQWVTPSCPLPDVCAVPIPDPQIVAESWTDWATADVVGPLKGWMTLTLNHSFTVTDNTITVGVTPVLNGEATLIPDVFLGPVVPDLRLIPTPLGPVPHVDKSFLFEGFKGSVVGIGLLAKVTGLDDDLMNEYVVDKMIAQQQARLNAIIGVYFPLQLQLPDYDELDPAVQALLGWVLDYLRDHMDIIGEFVLDTVKQHWTEILYYALTNNQEALVQFFAYQAICPNLENLKSPMQVHSLYSRDDTGVCSAVDPRLTASGTYYSDSVCQNTISYQPENFARFCQEALTPKPNPLLGNAAAWPSLGLEVDSTSTLFQSTKWSLATGAQLAVGAEPIGQNHAPYVKRINYRQINNCALEMRVYKSGIGATNQTPLLWIHGGAWTYRSSGFLGLESLVSNYTEQGYVVFAPFYRVAGDKDANAECRNASVYDMASDVEAALDWVLANSAAFGASNTGKIAVTGQSAGAHLAGWLMTHQAAKVSRGMLVYPPTDLHDFLARLQGIGGASFPPLSDEDDTPYDPSSAQDILETLLQLPSGGARTIDLTSTVVADNSYADLVRTGLPQNFPPAYILHGTRDSLLSYSQAQVMCEGYGGVVNVDWSATADLRAIFSCGGDSELHLFKEADHAFEVCPFLSIPSACRAGSPASATLLVESLQQGRQWLKVGPLLNGVAVTGLAGVTNSEQTFTFNVPAGVYNLTFNISGGSGDADMYVRFGAPPSLDSYDCRPYVDGNDETCIMPVASVGTWYITIRGYTNYSDLRLVASYSDSVQQLQSGVPLSGLSGAEGSLQIYTFEVPAVATTITIQITGGSGDADLYVRHGALPSADSYDCRPYLDGNEEVCTLPATAGTWYVLLHAYTAFNGVTLTGGY